MEDVVLKLFLSFRSLLLGLQQLTIPAEDLETGLFYLECCRERAFAPWKYDDGTGRFNELTYLFTDALGKSDGDAAAVSHRRLVAVLEAAEASGRAVWRPSYGTRTYTQLNELLEANGLHAINAPADSIAFITGADWHIRDALRASGHRLIVDL